MFIVEQLSSLSLSIGSRWLKKIITNYVLGIPGVTQNTEWAAIIPSIHLARPPRLDQFQCLNLFILLGSSGLDLQQIQSRDSSRKFSPHLTLQIFTGFLLTTLISIVILLRFSQVLLNGSYILIGKTRMSGL